MKDTLMTISFANGDIKIWHKSMMGDIGDLFSIGNSYRFNEGKPPLQLATWVQRQDVKEYIAFLSDKLGTPAIIRRKGKGGGTLAHLNVLIDAAASMSPTFKDEVYETFINQKILIHRDESGENFKDMNQLLALHADTVLGKPAHTGHYIQLAKGIKERIGVNEWSLATAYQLQKRADMEDKIATMLKLGVVRDWDHLKELVGKL